jgi:hypothetical protein
VVVSVILVGADTNVGGCAFNGGNQSNVQCNGNKNNVGTTSNGISRYNFPMSAYWIAILSLLFSAGLVAADESAGGCIIDGGSQGSIACSNNTNNVNSSPASNGQGMSGSDKIALGVGIGLGLPALIVAVVGVIYQIRKHNMH